LKRKLNDILKEIEVTEIIGETGIVINSPVFDSRKAGRGDLFIAVRGTQSDGHHYIADVIDKKVAAVLCETLPETIDPEVTFVCVQNSAVALAKAASAYWDYPSRQLKIIGVTGTNGKTSSVFFLYQLFTALGFKAGMLTTIENRIGAERIAATHTTADAIQINENLHKMVERGCDYCFMEISSHAIDQERIAGLKIEGAVFTNITHDHLDYHKTFDNYIAAKKKLFDHLPKESFALTNADDRNAQVMMQNTQAKKATYSLKRPSDFKGKIIENHFEGLHLQVDNHDVWCKLIGSFNACNLMAVYAVARLQGLTSDEILPELSRLTPVEGRFEVMRSAGGITAIVDYAHTPDALKNVLQTINTVRSGSGHLITVIGAGGDRDKQKRPILAKIAAQYSDRVILTSDNPRSENPGDIIDEMEAGLDQQSKRKVVKITDRREAIKTACMISLEGDIILVAGKGHETYQEIKGVRLHFDDREVINEFLNPKLKNTD
jgi:UDP-N-acetylmuramoyl-L-alanyl-D-glutamate--2,6-diaminopimelate ligase